MNQHYQPVSSSRSIQLSSRQVARARRFQIDAELRIFEHRVETEVLSAMDQIDSQATADAIEYALGEEIGLLERGLARAGASRAALELVARKVELFSLINNRRVSSRFGHL